MKNRNFSVLAATIFAGLLNATLALGAFEVSTFRISEDASLKFNGMIQGWSVGNDQPTHTDEGYRLRRAELKLNGSYTDRGRAFFMIDPARLVTPYAKKHPSAVAMLQDLGVGIVIAPGWEFTVGQLKIPATAEGLDSSSDLPLPERSLQGRTYGDRREIGTQLRYKTARYSVVTMLSTAHHICDQPAWRIRDAIARGELYLNRDWTIGSYVIFGDWAYSSKGRWGANARYRHKAWDARVEYGNGRDGGAHSEGATIETGYFVTRNIEPVARFETFSPHGKFGDAAHAETVGVNYFLRDYNTKVQIAGSALQNLAAPNGTPTLARGARNSEVILALQAAI